MSLMRGIMRCFARSQEVIGATITEVLTSAKANVRCTVTNFMLKNAKMDSKGKFLLPDLKLELAQTYAWLSVRMDGRIWGTNA
jgi:hypothetical protein